MSSDTVIIRNALIFFPILVRPTDPQGSGYTWSMQIRTHDPSVADEWRGIGVKVRKNKRGYFFSNLIRYVSSRDGKVPHAAPRLMSYEGEIIKDRSVVGNGSSGNIKAKRYTWSRGQRSGINIQFISIQATDIVRRR